MEALMDALIQDFRFAWRTLRRRPGVALLAVFCMALGIGAVTTVYGTARAFTFRPLPMVRDAGRLLYVWEAPASAPNRYGGVSPAAFRDIAGLPAFSSIASVQMWEANVEGLDLSERVRGVRASASLLHTLGRRPALGRDLIAADDDAGGERAVLLGYGLWQRRFGGDTALVGRTVRINGEGYTVRGILPEDFMFPAGTQLVVPLAFTPAEWAVRGDRSLFMVGRLAPGVEPDRAAAEVATLGRRLASAYPDASADWNISVMDAETFFGSGPRPFMVVLLASVVFVLLIACANVANLLLVRATGRRREIAVRLALGASPWRIARETLAESAIIAFVGGALGCVLAVWGLGATATSVPVEVRQYIPGFGQLQLDWQALALTAVVAACSALLFGLAPALTAARSDVQRSLRDGGRGDTGGSRTRHLRSALVVVEVALALQLLVGATLMVDTFRRLSRSDPGFRTAHVLTFGVTLPSDGYRGDSVQTLFFDRLEDRIATLPDVEAVGSSTVLPMTWNEARTPVEAEGRPLRRPEDAPTIGLRQVSASYTGTLGIPVLRGRGLDRLDGSGGPDVALISEAAAQRLWPGEEALGKRLRARALGGGSDRWIEIVGVTANVRGNPLASSDPLPVLYVPRRQWASRSITFVVRTGGDPEAVMPAIRREIAAMDSRLAAGDVAAMPTVVASAVSPQSATAQILATAALVALLLAAAGIFGVMAYGVTQRTREFGVRIALGAPPSSIVGLVLGHSVRLSAVGVVLGIGGAVALGRGMKAILYETDAWDPFVIGGVAVVLGLVTLLAGWVPARRAVSVSPMEALGAE
jgi:putative ABC transport system permease protein